MRNRGHPNQHLHASVECTRWAALGAEQPHTRFAEAGLWAQIGALAHPDFWFPTRSGCPQNASRARRFAGFGQAAEQARVISKSM